MLFTRTEIPVLFNIISNANIEPRAALDDAAVRRQVGQTSFQCNLTLQVPVDNPTSLANYHFLPAIAIGHYELWDQTTCKVTP